MPEIRMPCFLQDCKVRIPKAQHDLMLEQIDRLVEGQAARKQSAGYYEEVRGGSAEAIPGQSFRGKNGEFFASKFLHERFGFPELAPDCKVYPKGQKTWAPDLPYDKSSPSFPPVHVKTVNAAISASCELSWTLQWANAIGPNGRRRPGGRDGMLTLSHEEQLRQLVVLVYLEYDRANEASIKGVLPVWNIMQCLGLPKKESLQKIKRCVYYKDLCERFPELVS